MRYQTAPLPDDHLAEPEPHHACRLAGAVPQEAGGPGRIRTYNLAVMSGQLYR